MDEFFRVTCFLWSDDIEIQRRWLMFFCIRVDCYDQTDAIGETPAVSIGADIESYFTETDNPSLVPSYADFLIAYPTQSCKLNVE